MASSSTTTPIPSEAEAAAADMAAIAWPTNAQSYDMIGKIGQGAFATVWRAAAATTDQRDGTEKPRSECAVKVLNLDHVDSNLAEIRSEVQAMRLSSHANVLPCYAAFCNETNLWLVTQFMSKGSSLHCLQTARRVMRRNQQKQRHAAEQQPSLQSPNNNDELQQPFDGMEKYILYILHQTLMGLQYIHENGQIHRDIKAGNILLDGNGCVKIADFGVSGWLERGGRLASSNAKAKTFVGTPCWMAPEVMEQVNGYDTKADIWSLGITALELAKGYAPYAKYPPMKVLILTIQEDPPSLDSYNDEDLDSDIDDIYYTYQESFSKNFSNLVDTCLQKNPAKRPTTQGLLSSKYLSDLQDPAQQEKRRQMMVECVCNLVPDVGGGGGHHHHHNQQVQQNQRKVLPGNAPVSILLSTDKDRPAGTTWVFADGSSSSGVIASSASRGGDNQDDEDVFAELDAFERETGGEHYSGTGKQQQMNDSQQTQPSRNIHHQQQQHHDADEDLDAFMDEFESNTAGEDFRR